MSVIQGSLSKEFYFDEGCHIRELYNREADKRISIAHARVSPGVTTKFHRLQGIDEYYVIISGKGRVDVGDEPPQDVSPGDVVVIPPGYKQRITNTGADDLIFLCCCAPKFDKEQYESLE